MANHAESIPVHVDASHERMHQTHYLLIATLLAVGMAAFVLWNAWVVDDAFITFRHVSNCLAGHGAVFNPGECVQGFTHPLWFLILLTGGTICDIYAFAIAVSLVLAVATVLALAVQLRNTPHAGLHLIAVVALLLSSRTFVEYQSSGLETPLTSFLLAAFWTWLLKTQDYTPQACFAAGLGCSLLMLTRPDHVLLCGPLLIGLVLCMVHTRRWLALPMLAGGLLPLLLWHGFATIYYGSPLPNTFYAKVALPLRTALPLGWNYFAIYAQQEPLHAMLIAVVLLFGTGRDLYALTRKRYDRLIPLCLHLSLWAYLLFWICIGGDCMQGRMVLPLIVGAVLLGCDRIVRHRSSPVSDGTITVLLAGLLTAGCCTGINRPREFGGFGAGISLLEMQAIEAPRIFALCTALLLGPAILASVHLCRTKPRHGLALFVILVAAQLLYAIALVGQDEPCWTGWITTLFSLGIAAYLWSMLSCGRPIRRPLATTLLAVLAAASFSQFPVHIRKTLTPPDGVWDACLWYRPPWHANRFRHHPGTLIWDLQDWARLGREAARYAEAFGPITLSHRAMGIFPHYAGPRVNVIDELGLTDAYVARLAAREDSAVGHIRHDIPRGYLESRGAINLLPQWRERLQQMDPSLILDARTMAMQARWDDDSALRQWQNIHTVISGDIRSPERRALIPEFARPRRSSPPGACP